MPTTDKPSEDTIIEAKTARAMFISHPATVTRGPSVNKLRDFMLDLQPDLSSDIDGLVKRIGKLTDQVVRVLEAGGAEACRQLGIDVGDLSDEYVKALAAGEMQDRQTTRSQRFSLWTLVASAVLSAVLAFAAGWITGGA